MPLLGAGSTGVLWYFLYADAFIGGIIWITIGLIYMLYLSNFFRRRLSKLDFEQADQPQEIDG